MLTKTDFYAIKQFQPLNKCHQILTQIFTKQTLRLEFSNYMITNHHHLNQYFTTYQYNSQSQKVIRGKINEYLILFYFQHRRITNLYPQASLFYIPDIKFDLVLFEIKKRIVVFSMKTTLRDRYKIAILEAQQLKKLDTRFEFYLLTNNTTEAQRLQHKISTGKVPMINQVVNLFDPSADIFFKQLNQRHFVMFNDINIIKNKKNN
ncbi:hypothetical protein [Candidatus Phytoplasma prunorum]|uniref:hypothetical protein n=1 Tax=Candidatus Phytoplasma prunorum TaxID=47565 RepID=UPI002FF222FA